MNQYYIVTNPPDYREPYSHVNVYMNGSFLATFYPEEQTHDYHQKLIRHAKRLIQRIEFGELNPEAMIHGLQDSECIIDGVVSWDSEFGWFGFHVGQEVCLKNKPRAHAFISGIYHDIPGGVRLDRHLDGFYSWNTAELIKIHPTKTKLTEYGVKVVGNKRDMVWA